MKRWWGIRHLRYAWWSWRVAVWAREWMRAGIGLGIPHSSDIAWLDRIWRGDV